jgi:hypothetical protein
MIGEIVGLTVGIVVGVLVKFVSDLDELEDGPPPPPPLLRKSSRPKLKRSWSELEDARLRVAKSNERTDVGDGAGAGVSAVDDRFRDDPSRTSWFIARFDKSSLSSKSWS